MTTKETVMARYPHAKAYQAGNGRWYIYDNAGPVGGWLSPGGFAIAKTPADAWKDAAGK